MFEYIKGAFELAFVDYNNYVKVELTGVAKDFPDIYYDYMMVGEFDLSIGGISGSTLDAASFLDTYSSDNRGGFTLNWGIDTSTANIEVVFNDFEGNRHRELWSFDAIGSVLNGELYVSSGAEAIVPAAKDITYTPTTVSFTVDQFTNPDFQDFTYSIETYDAASGAYVPVDGFTDVAITAAAVTATGLAPGYDDYPTMYVGDYQIVINFVYAANTEKDGSTTSAWWMQPSTVDSVTDASTTTALDVTLVLNADFTAAVASAELLNADYTVNAATVTVAGLQLTASGLTADTGYVVKVTYDNGVVDYVMVSTPAA